MSLIPPLLPYTPFSGKLWLQSLLFQHYCALPAIATLSSSWRSISYLEEEGFLHSQPRLGTHSCLSHNPADPVIRAANRSGKEASLQTTQLHRKQETVLCQLLLHHLFWQLMLHADRADRWEGSFHSQDPSHQGFLSAQGKWFSLLSAQWNIKHVPQTSSSLVAANSWAFMRRKEQQVKLLSTGFPTVKSSSPSLLLENITW